MRRVGAFCAIMILMAGTACSQVASSGSDTAAEAATEKPDGMVLCTDPRPEICTQQYDPVCGSHRDGARKTYPNQCAACSNAEVAGASPGACPAQ